MISVLFIIECVIKIIALGFFWEGKGCYLHDPWNVYDFNIVIFSIVSLARPDLTQFNAVRAFRALHAMKPLRVFADEGI